MQWRVSITVSNITVSSVTEELIHTLHPVLHQHNLQWCVFGIADGIYITA